MWIFFSSLIEQKNSDHEVTEAVIIKNEFDDVQNRWWSFFVAVVRVVDVSGSVTNTGQIYCGVQRNKQTKIFSFFLFTGIFWKKKQEKKNPLIWPSTGRRAARTTTTAASEINRSGLLRPETQSQMNCLVAKALPAAKLTVFPGNQVWRDRQTVTRLHLCLSF